MKKKKKKKKETAHEKTIRNTQKLKKLKETHWLFSKNNNFFA